ncbi:MAG TPA: tRNA uridine-5-carboxymethylaminomethyl(34) synthesis enzyme MnmG, partial [Nitrolancea sp.]|nr:tRNA uridine-5-carboxymethylaminomethyl(34) synthesis enzyme MnmG [Nitrolancea sp.]
GLVAGLNAAAFTQGAQALVLRRDQSYIGVMIDDLTTQEFIEPYRMLTSRAEHRLLLRSDNADSRLAGIGYGYGLIGRERYAVVQAEAELVSGIVDKLSGIHLSANGQTDDLLTRAGLPVINRSMTAQEYVRRQDVTYDRLATALTRGGVRAPGVDNWELPERLATRVEVEARYAAYIEKELAQVERARRLESRRIPEHVDFSVLPSLRSEAREKLERFRPATVGQASRIAGVTPGDVAVLLVHLEHLESSVPR